MVKALFGKFEQLEQSYSEGDSEDESDRQTQAEPYKYVSNQQSYQENIIAPCEKTV